MATIERTAYLLFTSSLTARLHTPTEEERAFVTNIRAPCPPWLTCLTRIAVL